MTPTRTIPPVALITGGSSGLGLALARHLDAEGWVVVTDARDANRLHTALDGTTVHGVPGDVTDAEHRAEGARVQHEQLEPAEIGDQLDELRPVVGICDVAGDAVHRRTVQGSAESGGVAGVGHHDPTGVVQGANEREAESGGATGDEGYGWSFC